MSKGFSPYQQSMLALTIASGGGSMDEVADSIERAHQSDIAADGELVYLPKDGLEHERYNNKPTPIDRWGINIVKRDVDDLHHQCQIPKGWRLVSEGGYHSKLVDDRGCERASIFCKSAMWDRDAFIGFMPRFRVDKQLVQRKEPYTYQERVEESQRRGYHRESYQQEFREGHLGNPPKGEGWELYRGGYNDMHGDMDLWVREVKPKPKYKTVEAERDVLEYYIYNVVDRMTLDEDSKPTVLWRLPIIDREPTAPSRGDDDDETVRPIWNAWYDRQSKHWDACAEWLKENFHYEQGHRIYAGLGWQRKEWYETDHWLETPFPLEPQELPELAETTYDPPVIEAEEEK